ncbi:hypothetical protein EDB87DRAFT_1682029 [Lactarius vividus]|nr:hypothetical protein EDB87DRAFT_1682029 [Lactarius vividus]
MRTPTQIRRHSVTTLSGRHRDGSSQIPVLQGTSTTTSTTPRHALPRKIAQGVFFVDPTSGDRDAALSTRTLVDLEITHAVVARGSDLRLSSGMKALFIGSHDPLSRVVAWMRAVRRLGACVIVSDVAAAAGYLVVELGLTPRSAWLRIARGIPPAGDLVLAKLCALALTHSEKDEVSRSDLALIKLEHSLAGIYIWETVFTMGFELDVLRGKRPYKWTIWPYLGTRYFGLAAFIVFFVDTDGGKVPCQPLIVANYALPTARQLRTLNVPLFSVAIWNRHVIMSSIAIAIWLAGLGLNIRNLTMVEASYDPILQTCITLKTHRGLTNAIAVLVVDIVLLTAMLIGLLRHAHRSSTGIWYLLYQQCIIWIALAGIAEIPPVVFLILNLNDPWNEMFTGVAITILSIGAARMYRALSKRGSLTEYSSEPPRASSGLPFSTFQARDPYNVRSPMHFAPAGTMSRSEGTTTDTPVFVPTDEIQVEFVPGASGASLAVPPKTQSKDAVTYQTVQLRPG